MNNDRFKFRIYNDTYKHYIPKSDVIIDGRTGKKFHGAIFSSEYTIEQCTGLKDKNGKLIYEGDIIRIGTHKCSCTVVYQDGCFLLDYETPLYKIIHMNVEIIGNIHDKEEE